MGNKEYPVTDEIVDLFEDSEVALECRNDAIKNKLCSTNRAIKFGRIYREKREEAWFLVRLLYPELSNKKLIYLWEKQSVTILE